jgi:hypothetical protein
MALPILDGNQSATTLSSILTGGEHIPAHTVVSLGTQAITDISGAVSGSVVSISNFPATQPVSIASVTIGNTVTIAGTVTANISAVYAGEASFTQADNPMMAVGGLLQGFNEIRPITIDLNTGGQIVAGTVTANVGSILGFNEIYLADADNDTRFSSSYPFPISGTVTANTQTQYYDPVNGINLQRALVSFIVDEITGESYAVDSANGLPISGTVTANLDANSPVIASQVETGIASYAADLANDPLPISGTVTIGSALPTGTNRIGVVTIGAGTVTIGAGTAQIGSVTASISNSVTIASFATSVTARLINPAGTAVTYAEVGTAGSPSIDVLSVQGVTAGSPVITTLLLSSTAITSGSFTSLASATLVPGNTARKMATVYNLGAGQLFVNAGATATTLGGGFMVALSSGDFYECDYTTTTLSAIFATAGTASWMSH